MNTVYISVVRFGVVVVLAAASLLIAPATASAASFNQSNLIEDADFTNVNSMNVSDVQQFLQAKGSFLATFSENGRSAAQIIVDAAHGFGDASGTINGISVNSSTGTVSPGVILVTLQKEQSLLTMTTQNNAALTTAMGYGCPDSGGCNPNYAGFTKQVENGAWQLRYNYERAQGNGFGDYQVGQSACFSNPSGGTDCVTYANRATASLYRYTPHVYNGNYNFWNMFTNTYQFLLPQFGAQAISWSSSDGPNIYPAIFTGSTGANFVLSIKNTGSSTWQRHTVFLGTDKERNRVPSFMRESGNSSPSGWETPNRILMQQTSVAPGETAVFNFWMQARSGTSPATYLEHFRLVANDSTWFGPEIWWKIIVRPDADRYAAQAISWSSSDGPNVYPSITAGGTGANFIISMKNTGSTT
ncbi:MAG: hypothetical protein AAB701_01820, partial [Patescibacteria group bacterium]